MNQEELKRQEERAKYFQGGHAGNHEGPQIVHWAGDDITHVALFRREADRDYVLKVLAERPAILAKLEAAQRLRDAVADCNDAWGYLCLVNALAAFDKGQQ